MGQKLLHNNFRFQSKKIITLLCGGPTISGTAAATGGFLTLLMFSFDSVTSLMCNDSGWQPLPMSSWTHCNWVLPWSRLPEFWFEETCNGCKCRTWSGRTPTGNWYACTSYKQVSSMLDHLSTISIELSSHKNNLVLSFHPKQTEQKAIVQKKIDIIDRNLKHLVRYRVQRLSNKLILRLLNKLSINILRSDRKWNK